MLRHVQTVIVKRGFMIPILVSRGVTDLVVHSQIYVEKILSGPQWGTFVHVNSRWIQFESKNDSKMWHQRISFWTEA